MFYEPIRIRGARTHNLKNVSLDIINLWWLRGYQVQENLLLPLVRRRTAPLRRIAFSVCLLSQMEKPEVDSIEGLSPPLSKSLPVITHVQRWVQFLWLFTFALCPCWYTILPYLPMVAQTVSEMVDAVKNKAQHSCCLPQWFVNVKVKPVRTTTRSRFCSRACWWFDIDTPPELDKKKKHTIELTVLKCVMT